jgi:hypothetical protein
VRDALRIFDGNGALVWVDDRNGAIDFAVALSVAHQSAGYDTLSMASDKDTVRHLSEQERRQGGLEGKGRRYMTDSGAREFSVGDRLMFLENSLGKRGLGVRNGDRGTVLQINAQRIVVEMDGAERRAVSFSPRTYKSFDYANACTVHKAQGASVDAAVCIIDRSACAELLFVAASRSKGELDIVVPRTAFRDFNEMAEHVTAHLSLKTTTRTYDEILSRTGGKQTIRVRNMEAQREATQLRRLYDASVVEPLRAIQSERIDHAREAYRVRKEDIAKSTLSIEDRLDANRQALRDMRREVTAVYRELKPQLFGQWLQERDELRDRARSTRNRDHEQSQSREQSEHQRRDHNENGFARAERMSQEPRRQMER